MRKSHASTWIAPIAILSLLAAVSNVQAGLNTASISIHFGADQPLPFGSFLAPDDTAGVVPSQNWNNETTNTGSDPALIQDVNGVASNGGAQVLWYATNSWSSTGNGEENNEFTGAERKLVSGYLDMQDNNPIVTFIQITNLPASFSGTYTVYIYALGGQPGRGGIYSVNEPANQGIPGTFQYPVASGRRDPAKVGNQGYFNGAHHVQAIGDDPLSPVGSIIIAHDLARGVDPPGSGTRGNGHVERCVAALVEDEALGAAAGSGEKSLGWRGPVAPRVQPRAQILREEALAIPEPAPIA